MARRSLVVGPEAAGSRLDAWLATLDQVGSRRRARLWLERGKIFLNRRETSLADAGIALAQGDLVELWADRPGSASKVPRQLAAARQSLRVAYEDDCLLVADKPAGLLVEPLPATAPKRDVRAGSRAQRRREASITLLDLVADHLRARRSLVPRVVHRIDRDTSGLVVFALRPAAWVHLKRQFARRTAGRRYLAVVEGNPEPQGTWRDTLAWRPETLRQTPARREDPRARDAVLSYRVVERFQNAALIEVDLLTGRRNQIRVQASLRGHPLVGERIYRLTSPAPRALAPSASRSRGHQVRGSDLAFGRQALHASGLTLIHPATGQPLAITSPLPKDMKELLERLRRRVVDRMP
ncbi:MAG: pseudouridine synthase [Vicinamibacterales bacterium]